MSAVDELEDVQSRDGKPDPMTAAEQLTAILDLASVGLHVTGARWVGQGSTATADLYLSDGSAILFDSVAKIGSAPKLTLEVAACTTATPRIKQPQAIRAVALVRALAEHEDALTMDQVATDWGAAYLQSATALDIDMNDQTGRWAAFCELERVDPITRSRAEGVSVAQASLVLRHTDGTRLVRCGWFRAYVKGEDSSLSPQQVANRMQRVGWQRRGTAGRVKATRPGHRGHLVWTFYSVPAGWEDDG